MPRGYRGIGHETLGSDILSIEDALRALTTRAAASRGIIGDLSTSRLDQVKPDGWYPIDWILDILQAVELRMGRYGLMKMGRMLFKRSHEARVVPVAKSGRDILAGLDAMYHHANRGEQIGGWQILAIDDVHADLEKTTPHNCHLEEGIIAEALGAVGCAALVVQERCILHGADSCLFHITPIGKGCW